MNNFQTILVAVFIFFFVAAVAIFSGLIKINGLSKSTTTPAGKVVIWGTFSNESFKNTVEILKAGNSELSVSYVRKDPSFYQQDLIEAFANGTAPDLFIITPDMIKKNSNFIYKIPYENYPEKTFRDSFIDGADIYMDSEGILGFPVIVDPIVLYYNKDILSNENIVFPPKSWDELFTLNSTLTKRDNSGTISQSMIALGQYANVNNVKDILATLLLQNNNPIVERGVGLGTTNTISYNFVLDDNPLKYSVSPIDSVLNFFLEFSDPSSTAYSWNRALPNSLDMFTGGKLAFYIGRASELFNIESINPNLSFDVAQIPQIKDSTIRRTYGEISAVVINKKSANFTTAFSVAGALSTGDGATSLSTALSLPPVSRILLSTKPNNPYLFTFFNGALISRSWLDPDKVKSNLIFKELIENILSNSLSMSEALNKTRGQFELLLK